MAMDLGMDSIYAEDINKLAKDHTDKIFYNSNERHATIVLRALVRNAEKYIKILCSNMCTDVSNNKEYLDLLESFLLRDSGNMISILFVNYNQNFCKQNIAKLFARYPEQVKIKKMTDPLSEVCLDESPVHFTVSDDRAFRLETDIENKMPYGNFNGIEKAKALSNVFDNYFNSDSVEVVNLHTCTTCCC